MKKLLCQYCSRQTQLVDSKAVHRKSHGLIYLCKPCQAWVKVHKGTTTPQGEVAKAELRQLRILAHKYFDALWRQDQKRRQARRKAYQWLARQLRIDGSKCHIGMFDINQCQRTIAICRTFQRKNRLQFK